MSNYPVRTLYLYSKYSNKCQEVLNVIRDVEYIEKVCVDSPQMREFILNANNIRVTVVPCVLVIYASGDIEKYDNHSLTLWLQEMIRVNSPPEEQQQLEKISLTEQQGYSEERANIMKKVTPIGGNSTEILNLSEENREALGEIGEEHAQIKTTPNSNDLKKQAELLQREREAMS